MSFVTRLGAYESLRWKDPPRRFQHIDDVKVSLQEVKEESESGTAATAVVPRYHRSVAHRGRCRQPDLRDRPCDVAAAIAA